jgi:cellulose synthase/poly-beta-1,6-N-acetylglucosamine synthase-like glycosyltransferase
MSVGRHDHRQARVEAELLRTSVHGLLDRYPQMSALRTLSRAQRAIALAVGAALLVGLVAAPVATLIALSAIAAALYTAVLCHAAGWFHVMVSHPRLVRVSDEDARSAPADSLPVYTVMVAAYGEANVIAETIRSLEALDYPRDRLELRLLLEADDRETIAAARATPHGPNLLIIEVPPAGPRTKPKACNYGLQLTAGELVTVYDAEDRPEPLQLRRAAVAFQRLGAGVSCLQAKLHYHNVNENYITRSFSAEYATWFACLLPALNAMGGPIPLGGTSMHIRRSALEAVGAWDPHNVTEDADLGIRLHRLGHRTEVLDSVTLEEANSDFVNWVRQRSRWYKGHVQTWLVHSRHPLRLWRELGTVPFISFHLVLGASPLLAILNPLFWLLSALWIAGHPGIVQTLFPAAVYYPAMACLIAGNFLAVYRTVVGVRVSGHPELVTAALLLPAYWGMMSIAAIRAFVQLPVRPSHWEKTVHGLSRQRFPPVPPAGGA